MAANVMEIYGKYVFNEHVMKERLPSATYKSLKATLEALGDGDGRHPLHPLVPAAHRHHQ